MKQLPAGGRRDPAPAWPLDAVEPLELHWWGQLWKKPQAIAWEREQVRETVARYCRLLAAFDKGAMSTAILVELRNLEDRLGLKEVDDGYRDYLQTPDYLRTPDYLQDV